jgi:outer membrane autotransporter protein
VHEFSTDRSLTSSLAALPGTDFTVFGPQPAANMAQVKAGFQAVAANGVTLFAEFDGLFGSGDSYYGGKGGLRYNF